jgi:hypothetical protein
MTVKRDGADVGQTLWGEEVPVDPGSHKVDVAAPHKKPWQTTVIVRMGSHNVDVPVPPLEDAPEPIAPPPVIAPPPRGGDETPVAGPQRGGPQRAIGGVLIGLGIVGLGFGTGFGVEAILKNNDSKIGGCAGPTGNSCDQAGTQLRDDALTAATRSTALFIVGGVVTAAGIVVVLAAPSGPQKKENVSVAPWLNRNGGGVGMSGAW